MRAAVLARAKSSAVWLVSAWCCSACLTAAQGVAPVIVVETSRGTFSFETFPNDAPVTVAHVVALVKSGFYDGQRVHRAIPGFVVQFGDPQTRDPSARQLWGRGTAAGSGKPIGAAEISRRRIHVKGAVAMAHMGDPAKADSQLYVTLTNRPDLDGQYAVFGQVIDGQEVVESLQVGDPIARMYIKQ
jgi:cyclophilin family peptidyl-prolyl cis-trans isomerase